MELDWFLVLIMILKKYKLIDISILWFVLFLFNLLWFLFDKYFYLYFRYMIFIYFVFIYFMLLRMWEIVLVFKFF